MQLFNISEYVLWSIPAIITLVGNVYWEELKIIAGLNHNLRS